MTSETVALKFKITYQNGDADDHHLDMYDAAISYLGFSKALNITVGAILNKQVKVKGHHSGGIRVYLETSKRGSFEQLITVSFENPLVVGITTNFVWEGIKYVWGSLLNQAPAAPNKKVMDRIEPIFDELLQAIETPVQEAHRPIVNDDKIKVDLTCGRKKDTIAFDKSTLKTVSEKVSEKIEEGRIGNITKYSNISCIGRYFDEDLDKTVPFHSEALSQYEQELLTWSLHEANKDITKGKLRITVIPIKTATGKLKRYDFLNVEKV